MGSLILPKSGLVYLDASPVIYSIEKVSPYAELLQPIWQSVQTGEFSFVASELLLLEVLVKPVQQSDKILENSFRQLLQSSLEFELVPITADILEAALQLRATTGIKTPDAIHAATALAQNCVQFDTNDKVFQRVPNLNVVVLQDVLNS